MFFGRKGVIPGAAGVFAAAGLLAGSVAMADDEIPAVNNGKWSFEAGVDVASAYWFRGISQGTTNDQGVIIQPYGSASVSLYESEDITLDVYFGAWNSFTTGHVAAGDGWYEADLFAGASIGLPMNFTLDVSYIELYGPAGGAEFAQEIDINIAYDDSDFWTEAGFEAPGFEGLQPYALFAIETAGASDGFGDGTGAYLELGISPSFDVTQLGDDTVTMSVPVAIGFSLDDYYETSATSGTDVFGFVSISPTLSMPLSCIPAEYGSWTASLGVTFLFLSDDLETISAGAGTGGDSVEYIGTFGLSMSY